MNCAITAGYTIDCNKNSVGGLAKVKIASKKDIVSMTETGGIVSSIVMVTGSKFYEFELVRGTSNFVSTPTPNIQNGSIFYAESLTLVFNKLKASTSSLVDNLAKASIVAIVEDKNGEVVLLGRSGGLDLSGGTIGSGTNSGDRSGYELSFAAEEAKLSHVDPTIVNALLSPAV